MNKKFLILLISAAIVLTLSMYNSFVLAQVGYLDLTPLGKTYIGLGAGIAVGLAGLGASLGMGTASAAAIGAISERPEVFGRSIIYIVLLEAIAIYGFVIGFLLVAKL